MVVLSFRATLLALGNPSGADVKDERLVVRPVVHRNLIRLWFVRYSKCDRNAERIIFIQHFAVS